MEAARVRAQLERILASATFAEADRPSRFLRFVVERALEGRAAEIKESVVAVEVLNRSPSFDPRSDPIVRTEAGRLRVRLSSYYEAEGKADEVRIVLPKGGYVPEFSQRQQASRPRKRLHPALLLACGALIALAVAVPAAFYLRRTPAHNDTLRFSILPPPGAAIVSSAVAPDGRRIAFTAVLDGRTMIWVRDLDSLEPKPLAGTEDASYPFWSPDSRSLGFLTRGKLKRIDVSGGPAQVLCDAGIAFGATWSSAGVILFPPRIGSLSQVPEGGGMPKPVTILDPARAEFSHRFPRFLPDGRHFLYFAVSARPGESSIRVGSLDSKESKFLLNVDAIGAYALPHGQQGLLLFVYGGALMAQSFDQQRLELGRERIVVTPKISYMDGSADVSVSATGVLAYQAISRKNLQLAWFDRQGKLLEIVDPLNEYHGWSLSPDEKRMAIMEADPSGRGAAIWILDLTRGVRARLTDDFPIKFLPIWSPDGSQILFSTGSDQGMSLQRQALNERTSVTVLEETPGPKFATDWSSDGRFVAYATPWPDFKKMSIFLADATGSRPRPPRPFLTASYSGDEAYFEPSSSRETPRWIAYTSDETGSQEVHVRNFPAGDRTWQVSNQGGRQPHWRRDGRELFYLTQDGTLMAVEVKANAMKRAAAFELALPEPSSALAFDLGMVHPRFRPVIMPSAMTESGS
jgi:eukaryotic-like serine/threonine-protein kinase